MLFLESYSKFCVCHAFCHLYHVTLDETKLALPYLSWLRSLHMWPRVARCLMLRFCLHSHTSGNLGVASPRHHGCHCYKVPESTSRVQVSHTHHYRLLCHGKGFSNEDMPHIQKTHKWSRSQELVQDDRAKQVLHHGRKCKAAMMSTVKETKPGRLKNCQMCPSGDLLPNLSWQWFPVGHAKDEVIRRVNQVVSILARWLLVCLVSWSTGTCQRM